LRKRQIIPEDTSIKATLTDPKLVHGQYGRQVELVVNVTEGGEDNEYKGTTFKTWFSFGKDNETKEEYIAYSGPLYQLLRACADRSWSARRSTLPTVAAPSFPDQPPYDDDHL